VQTKREAHVALIGDFGAVNCQTTVVTAALFEQELRSLVRGGDERAKFCVGEKNVGAPTFKVTLEVFTDR